MNGTEAFIEVEGMDAWTVAPIAAAAAAAAGYVLDDVDRRLVLRRTRADGAKLSFPSLRCTWPTPRWYTQPFCPVMRTRLDVVESRKPPTARR